MAINAITFIVAIFAAAHVALLIWSFRLASPTSARLWIIRLLLAGMIYDNLMLALGNIGVGSGWYAAASTGRFVLHAALLPLLIPFALSAMRACEVALASRRAFVLFCWLVAVAAWCYGFWHDVGQLVLVPHEVMGHLRLTSAAELPPFGTIAVNLLLLPLAYLIWRRAGSPWLLAGASFILIVNGAVGAQPWGFVAGNGTEMLFVLCLLLTERFVGDKSLALYRA